MIVYSQNYVFPVSLGQADIDQLNLPLIGWQTAITGGSLTADTEQDGFPALNLITPVTYQRWRGELISDTPQYLTFIPDEVVFIDYLAIAGHNFSSGGFAVQVEGQLVPEGAWSEISPEVIPSDDGPLLFRFNKAAYAGVRLAMRQGSTDPYAAVLFSGELLTLPRRIYVGHSPVNLNLKTDAMNGLGETGQFLGRIIRRQYTQTGITMSNIAPSFYRQYMKPWVQNQIVRPFFFAWRPYSYPLEVGYCWGTQDAAIVNDKSNGTMKFTLPMQGLVT